MRHRTPKQDGFEAGIMRRLPNHPYILQTTQHREYMEGFVKGRERRAWLDARGQARVETVVFKNGPGDWHWEVLVEKVVFAQGWAKSEKAALQMAENANMDRVV